MTAQHPAADNMATDQDLIKQIKSGNRSSLAALYGRHSPQMLGLAMRILQNQRDSEDLLHDVFLEVWQKASQYDSSRASVQTWLMLRTRSRAIDRIRALTVAREKGILMQSTEESDTDKDDPSLTPDNTLARKALDQLSKVQRLVIELSYFEGLTCREIAAECDIPVGTVKSRLSAAIVKLRQHLEPAGRAL